MHHLSGGKELTAFEKKGLQSENWCIHVLKQNFTLLPSTYRYIYTITTHILSLTAVLIYLKGIHYPK